MSISDGKIDNSSAQHLPQTELVACPHATQYLCSIQLEELIPLFLHFTIHIVATRRVATIKLSQLQPREMESLVEVGGVTVVIQSKNGQNFNGVAVADNEKKGRYFTEMQLHEKGKMKYFTELQLHRMGKMKDFTKLQLQEKIKMKIFM